MYVWTVTHPGRWGAMRSTRSISLGISNLTAPISTPGAPISTPDGAHLYSRRRPSLLQAAIAVWDHFAWHLFNADRWSLHVVFRCSFTSRKEMGPSFYLVIRATRWEPSFDTLWSMPRPGSEPRSTAWKAVVLATTPQRLSIQCTCTSILIFPI